MREVKDELVGLAGLAWPVIVSQLGLMGMGVIDFMLAGRLERVPAMTVANTWGFGVAVLPFFLLLALDPVVSQSWGAGRPAECAQAARRGLVLALLLAQPLAAAWLFAGPGLTWLGQPAESIRHARAYCLWLVPGAIPLLGFQALRTALQGMGVVRPVMLLTLLATAFHLAASWVLVLGVRDSPGFGLAGTGMATSLSRWFLFLGTLWIARARLGPGLWRAQAGEPTGLPLGRLALLGLPLGVQYSLEVWVFTTVSVLMGWLGEAPLGGHGIALQLASLSFMFPLGLSAAASVRVGQAIGRGDGAAMRRAAWVAAACGVAVMAVSSFLFLAIPERLAGLYSRTHAVAAAAVLLLPVAALFQFFDGFQAIGFGVLRGTGDTRLPMLFNLAGYYALALPLGWWLTFRNGAGPRGLWFGLAAGLALVSLLLLARMATRLRLDLKPIVPGVRAGA